MAAAPASSLFLRLTNAWRLLSLRNDIDNIIQEIIGVFSLEKIYAEGDQETYQRLVITLIAQLQVIFWIQRLSIPSENLQVSWYLGFLASWEVTLRSVEFVLQTVLEGRDSLWEVEYLRDKHLAEFLLAALRVLALHPKAPTNQRAKDRRDRFSRIHRSLERVFDSYAGNQSFLLLVCKEVTDSLRTESDSLALPPGLKYEIPNLASELYPLADCLSSQHVSTIVTINGFSGDWLPQFLALRDVSHFVVGASVQYSVNRETRDVKLQASSARTRNAVLRALDKLRLPAYISKADLISTFSETFRVILPETPSLVRQMSSTSQMDENEIDAIDALCVKLSDRQVIHRMSDREMMHAMSEITRKVALVDDPTGLFRAPRPRLYAVNCESCHLFGDTHLKSLGYVRFPPDTEENCEVALPPQSACATCGQPISLMREVSVIRNIWETLKPLEPNADTINVERHLPTQFQQLPPKAETGILYNSSYTSILAGGQRPQNTSSGSPRRGSPERSRSIPNALLPPVSPDFRQLSDGSRTDFLDDGNTRESAQGETYKTESDKTLPPFSPDSIGPGPSQTRFDTASSSVSFDPVPLPRSRTVHGIHIMTGPSKGKSKWRSKFGSRRESIGTSVDSSSLSSATLEGQRLEEISLKAALASASNKVANTRAKNAKTINVSLAQNSTYALFWTQFSIYIWDVGMSPPIIGRAITTESTCVLAAVSKVHLAYIVGTREQRLTLNIVNLIQPAVPVVEYRMPSSPWCRSIAICPKENSVVVGFDNSIVRFFSTGKVEEPREDRLHIKNHAECKECQPVETLSFSNDGLILLAGTRRGKSGMIQVYSWRFPFLAFEEVIACRYQVPLHESEDGGLSSVIYRSGAGDEDNLICITTWTQSGTPILIQTQDGHRTDIRSPISNRQNKLGNRVQCAAFSPSGKELAIVNDKGDLYKVINLNSSPMEVKKIAVSKELTSKSESFAMAFMMLPDEEAVVMAWADSSKGTGYVKKIPTVSSGNGMLTPSTPNFSLTFPNIPGVIPESPTYELAAESKPPPPVELLAPHVPQVSKSSKGFGLSKHSFF